MKESLTDKVREARRPSVYKEAAKKFDTSYDYVIQIASGRRKALRKKGKAIYEWIEGQLNK